MIDLLKNYKLSFTDCTTLYYTKLLKNIDQKRGTSAELLLRR